MYLGVMGLPSIMICSDILEILDSARSHPFPMKWYAILLRSNSVFQDRTDKEKEEKEKTFGEVMRWVGPDKIIQGSDDPTLHVQMRCAVQGSGTSRRNRK